MVNAKVMTRYSQGEEGIFILSDRDLGELGWVIYLAKRNHNWEPHPYLQNKYAETFSNLLSQLSKAFSSWI